MNNTSNVNTRGGAFVATSSPRPPTQVSSHLSEMFAELDSLEKAVESHAVKLDPVLSFAGDAAENGKCMPPDQTLCGVADSIRRATRRMTEVRIRLESLTARTEA